MSNAGYKAFITYSHSDARAAIKLQRGLESYRVPSRLVGKQTARGKISRRIGSVFRDRDELSAGGDLNQSVNNALTNSEYLIVICSPAARQSRWVNLEISAFRESHGDDRILCYIVGGEPFAADAVSQQELECFPEALGYLEADAGKSTTHEPIAADIRPGADGSRLAKLKIISGLLGIGLDELIQRDAQRRQRNLIAVSLASATGMLAMAVLSFIAIDARNNEELRRAEAEDLIEFMLSDLRDRLDVVGRLDVLDAVGEKAIEYYSNVELEEHSESSLGRRARAFHLLGEVDDLQGDMESARSAFNEAYQSTGELLARAQNDGERVYNHAQSVFWVGYLDWRLGNYEQAEPAFQEYLSLANRLAELDSTNADWFVETGHANLNLGVYTLGVGSPTDAIIYFERGLQVFESLSGKDPESVDYLWLLAQSIAWISTSNERDGLFDVARDYRLKEVEIYRNMQLLDPGNQLINSALLVTYHALAKISLALGDTDIAVDTLFESKAYGDELLVLDAENTFVVQEVAGVYATLSQALNFTENSAQAVDYINQAENMILALVERDRTVLEWNAVWYRIHNILSRNLLRNGEVKQAIVKLRRVIEEMEQLVSNSPGSRAIREYLAEAHFYLAKAFESIGDDARAEEQLALVVQEYSSIPGVLAPQMKAYLRLTYETIGSSEQAAELAMELEDRGYRHPDYLYYQ